MRSSFSLTGMRSSTFDKTLLDLTGLGTDRNMFIKLLSRLRAPAVRFFLVCQPYRGDNMTTMRLEAQYRRHTYHARHEAVDGFQGWSRALRNDGSS